MILPVVILLRPIVPILVHCARRWQQSRVGQDFISHEHHFDIAATRAHGGERWQLTFHQQRLIDDHGQQMDFGLRGSRRSTTDLSDRLPNRTPAPHHVRDEKYQVSSSSGPQQIGIDRPEDRRSARRLSLACYLRDNGCCRANRRNPDVRRNQAGHHCAIHV